MAASFYKMFGQTQDKLLLLFLLFLTPPARQPVALSVSCGSTSSQLEVLPITLSPGMVKMVVLCIHDQEHMLPIYKYQYARREAVNDSDMNYFRKCCRVIQYQKVSGVSVCALYAISAMYCSFVEFVIGTCYYLLKKFMQQNCVLIIISLQHQNGNCNNQRLQHIDSSPWPSPAMDSPNIPRHLKHGHHGSHPPPMVPQADGVWALHQVYHMLLFTISAATITVGPGNITNWLHQSTNSVFHPLSRQVASLTADPKYRSHNPIAPHLPWVCPQGSSLPTCLRPHQAELQRSLKLDASSLSSHNDMRYVHKDRAGFGIQL